MTQPAKSQEPSMEEILASIRRIIADDDAGKTVKRPTEVPATPEVDRAFAQPAVPQRPALFVPPEPIIPDIPAEPQANSAAISRAEQDHAAAILDLTESMTARLVREPISAPVQGRAADVMSQFRESEPTPQREEGGLPPQDQEPDQARQFHEPEQAPVFQDQELDQAPQFHDVEPGPAPETDAPDQAAQLPMTEDYSDEGLEQVAEQPARPVEQAAPYVAPETEQHGARERAPLLSSATVAAVDSAFNALAHTVLVQNARTLEDLVREMLRPMLKAWLDDNLPGLVERLVRAEIERVARGRQ